MLVVSGRPDLPEDPNLMMEAFGEGPVVIGPTVPSLAEAHRSAADALSALRAVAAWPAAPRPVPSADLLPERALAGDPEAERLLVDQVMRPLVAASGSLIETLDAFFDAGGVWRAAPGSCSSTPIRSAIGCAGSRTSPGRCRATPDALVLRVGLAVGRLARSRGLW